MIAGARDCPAMAALARGEHGVALIHELVDGGIVRGDLLLDCATAVRILACQALQLCHAFLGRDDIRVAVIVLRLSGCEGGFRGGERGVAMSRPPALRNELPVLILERGDLSTEAARIDQRRRPAVCKGGSVPRLERRELPFKVGNLPLELARLILQEPNG